MDRHVRTLAIFNIFFGVVGGMGALALLIVMGGPAGFIDWAEGSGGYGFLLVGSTIFHLVLAIPCILGGVFLLQFYEWARLLMIFVSALNLLNAPVGAAIGAFGLWVLFQPETEPLFLDPVLRTARSGGRNTAGRSTSQSPRGTERSPDTVPPTIKPARTNLPE